MYESASKNGGRGQAPCTPKGSKTLSTEASHRPPRTGHTEMKLEVVLTFVSTPPALRLAIHARLGSDASVEDDQ